MGNSTSSANTVPLGKKSTTTDVLKTFGVGQDSLSGTVAIITGGHSGCNCDGDDTSDGGVVDGDDDDDYDNDHDDNNNDDDDDDDYDVLDDKNLHN